jgi:predicted HicB family RNase H-like nuclease
MKDMMAYKGYVGSVHYSEEDGLLFGKVEFIRSLISYEGKDIKSLRVAFEEAVDDYLALCAERSLTPEQPFKGSFNVRTGSKLHRRAVLYAKKRDIPLNTLVVEALEKYLTKT